MVINWYGEACFKIQSGETVILTDPFESSTGLTPPRFKADITLVTQPVGTSDFPTSSTIGPGNYEIKGVEITGLPLSADKTIYLISMEDMRLGLLGHIGDEAPAAEIMEKLNGVDLLFVPAGGAPHIDQEKAAKLIKQINPRLVIVSLFKTPGLKRKAGDVKEFLQELEKKAEPQEKLTIKKKDLSEKTEVIVLKV